MVILVPPDASESKTCPLPFMMVTCEILAVALLCASMLALDPGWNALNGCMMSPLPSVPVLRTMWPLEYVISTLQDSPANLMVWLLPPTVKATLLTDLVVDRKSTRLNSSHLGISYA